MSEKERLVDCIFCGDTQVPGADEDVLPTWVGKKLAFVAESLHPGAQPIYVNHTYDNRDAFTRDTVAGEFGKSSSGKSTSGARPVPYKLPEVCRVCNGGWMSRLETAVNPIMEGFIFGRSKIIDPYDQMILANWTIKTCLTYDAALAERLITEEMGSRLFYRLGLPPLWSHVVIGHDPNHTPEGAFGHERLLVAREDLPVSCDWDVVRFTFQFDHLILRATINCTLDYSKGTPVASLAKAPKYEEIWPGTRRLWWPSDAAKITRSAE
jgi:hypothetical protein